MNLYHLNYMLLLPTYFAIIFFYRSRAFEYKYSKINDKDRIKIDKLYKGAIQF